MPRRNNPARPTGGRNQTGRASNTDSESGRPFGVGRTELWRGVDYCVRASNSAGSDVLYRCPGCDQQLAAGRPHIVAWPADDLEAVDRRHWHGTCWRSRETRAPGVIRARNAPKYG